MILLGIGGAVGAAARYVVGISLHRKGKHNFPYSTWIVNLAGSFLLGLLANFYSDHQITKATWTFFGAGFCGAFTTFSTFSVETIQMIHKRQLKRAVLYVTSSVLLGVGFAAIGYNL